MIQLDGVEYGQADEIAVRLGADVTAAMIRAWARRRPDLLPTHRTADGTVWFPRDLAIRAERVIRQGGRGRPRHGALDSR